MAEEKTILEQVASEPKAPQEPKKLAVYDKDGKLMGWTGPDPEPEGPSAAELITEGFHQRVANAEREMVPVIEQMTQDAKAARGQLHESRKTAGMYSQSTPFLKAVDVFENNLERHFTEEVPFVLNRF